MKELEALKSCYRDYLKLTETLAEKASPTAGLLGLTAGPEDDPRHEEFYDRVGVLTAELLAAQPDDAALLAAAELILRSAAERGTGDLAYGFLFAAQKHAGPLIPLLSKEDCARLRDEYDRLYPKRDRMPVQREVFRLLKRRAG